MSPSVILGVSLVTFVVSLALGWAVACCTTRQLEPMLRWTRRLAPHRWLVLSLLGGLAAGVAAGVSLLRPPLPRGADEFSYLLAADTFAHGRLTNPTHPQWRHFETFHVIQQPTYASKYPPAQGLILALGKVLGGTPNLGLWLSAGLAAIAAGWMLQGWMPGRWALLGGLLVALHPKIQLAWSQTYWGGDMAFAGGALLLGAYPRIVRDRRWHDALLMGLGLAMLANSRPYEGLAVSLPIAGAMLMWLWGHRRPAWDAVALRIVLPLGAVLLGTAAWMAWYNLRGTGEPLKMPYAVHEATYGCTPPFLWRTPGPIPEYRHEVIRRLHVEVLRAAYEIQQSWSGLLRVKGTELLIVWQFFLGIGLTIPLAGLCRVPLRRLWVPLATLLAGLAALVMTTWANPHYFAPAAPALLLLVMQGLRHWTAGARQREHSRSTFVRALVLAQLLSFPALAWFHITSPPHPFAAARAGLQAQLERVPGPHLVIVKYSPTHNPNEEWVYNEADIDGSAVVWARRMGWGADGRLCQYFAGRRIWLLMADETPPRLTPHPPPNGFPP